MNTKLISFVFIALMTLILIFIVYSLVVIYTLDSKDDDLINDENCGVIQTPILTHYVYNGKTADIQKWPWNVHLKVTFDEKLQDKNHLECGATIINNNLIATTAFCFTKNTRPNIFILNNNRKQTNNQNYVKLDYKNIFIFPNYKELKNGNTSEYSVNDIALVKTNKTLTNFTTVRPCLPSRKSIIPFNSTCIICGYGQSNPNDTDSAVKQFKEGRTFIEEDYVCMKKFDLSFYDHNSMLCAGAKNNQLGSNSCFGDGGSPLVCEGRFNGSDVKRWFLVGLTSFGSAECTNNTSSVYTRVESFVDWINDVDKK